MSGIVLRHETWDVAQRDLSNAFLCAAAEPGLSVERL
jgi:hypothetical protein